VPSIALQQTTKQPEVLSTSPQLVIQPLFEDLLGWEHYHSCSCDCEKYCCKFSQSSVPPQFLSINTISLEILLLLGKYVCFSSHGLLNIRRRFERGMASESSTISLTLDWPLSLNLFHLFVFLCLLERMVYQTGYGISSFERICLFLIKSKLKIDLPTGWR
jgi:hypothetical protein